MVTMLRLLPMGLFGAFLGALAERFDRRLTLAGMVVLLMAVTSAVLAVVAWTATLEVWHLAVASFINGCGWATDNPVRRVMMGEVVGREQHGHRDGARCRRQQRQPHGRPRRRRLAAGRHRHRGRVPAERR